MRERVFPTSFYLWNIRHSWRQTRLCTNKIIIFKKKWFVFNFAFISNSSDSFTNSVTTNLRIFSTKMNVMYRKLVKPSDEFNSTYELFTKCFHEKLILISIFYQSDSVTKHPNTQIWSFQILLGLKNYRIDWLFWSQICFIKSQKSLGIKKINKCNEYC